MKRLPLILSVLSLIGVIVLFVISLSSKPVASDIEAKVVEKVQSGDSGVSIAYIVTDSVLVNYQLSLDLNDEFVKTQSQYNNDFARKRSAFERDAVAFQEKIQTGGFLTEERAIRERDRLVSEEQEIQRLDYELSGRLSELEQKIHMQIVDSIVGYVREYNKAHQYSYIFSNSGNILVGDQQHNITKDIVEGLNARYTQSKAR